MRPKSSSTPEKFLSRMPTAYLQTMRASVATTRRCSGEGDPQVNKFEHISKVGHQMSVAGGRVRGPRSDGWSVSGRSLKSDVGGGGPVQRSPRYHG